MHRTYLKIMKEREKLIDHLEFQLKGQTDAKILRPKEIDLKRGENQKKENFEMEKIKDAVTFKRILEGVSDSNKLLNPFNPLLTSAGSREETRMWKNADSRG
jgi:hypothetical protein